MDEDINRCTGIPMDIGAFERVLLHYDPLIRRAIRHQIWLSSLHDEVYQEVVVLLMRKFHLYSPRHPIEAWLYTVTRNACISYMRKLRPQADYVPISDEVLEILGSTLPLEAALQDDQDRRDIAVAWQTVEEEYPDRMRLLAFKWHYIDGMTTASIASKLQIPHSTVKSWPAAVAQEIHPQMVKLLEGMGWEFNGRQQLSPRKRKAMLRESGKPERMALE